MRRKPAEDNTANQTTDQGKADYVIPVIEEEVIIGKKIVSKGGIIVTKEVITEETIAEVPLISEHIDVVRIPVNEYREVRPEIRTEGDTTIIPVLKEVIEKRLLLVEEIRITKNVTSETRQEKVTLSREKVTVREKTDDKGSET